MPPGFTLVELMISVAASVAVLGALFYASMSIQKMLHGSETYAVSYSDQRRIIDYLGRDLRRALTVDATDTDGVRRPLAQGTVTIADRATVIVTLPGFYQSDVPADGNFDQALTVVPGDQRPEYGTDGAGPAPTVEIVFRKVFVAGEGSTCFVRQEAADLQVVVRQADNLYVQASLSTDGHTGLVNAWFRAPFTSKPLVSTYDAFMLRNTPTLPTP